MKHIETFEQTNPANNWRQLFRRVSNWEPSRRPRYRHKLGGEIWRLDDVSKDGVVLRQDGCQRAQKISCGTFERDYINVG